MIVEVVDELEFATPWVIVRFVQNRPCSVGDHRSGLQMVGEVVGNRACREISSRHALAVEEDVLARFMAILNIGATATHTTPGVICWARLWLGTIRPGILRRSQPIQRVVGKRLVAGRVFSCW